MKHMVFASRLQLAYYEQWNKVQLKTDNTDVVKE